MDRRKRARLRYLDRVCVPVSAPFKRRDHVLRLMPVHWTRQTHVHSQIDLQPPRRRRLVVPRRVVHHHAPIVRVRRVPRTRRVRQSPRRLAVVNRPESRARRYLHHVRLSVSRPRKRRRRVVRLRRVHRTAQTHAHLRVHRHHSRRRRLVVPRIVPPHHSPVIQARPVPRTWRVRRARRRRHVQDRRKRRQIRDLHHVRVSRTRPCERRRRVVRLRRVRRARLAHRHRRVHHQPPVPRRLLVPRIVPRRHTPPVRVLRVHARRRVTQCRRRPAVVDRSEPRILRYLHLVRVRVSAPCHLHRRVPRLMPVRRQRQTH